VSVLGRLAAVLLAGTVAGLAAVLLLALLDEPEPGPEPRVITQRDLDDAVAALITRARAEYRRGLP